jgi:hypothetical protein
MKCRFVPWPIIAVVVGFPAAAKAASACNPVVVLDAVEFGVKADGVTDDGAAIERMLRAVAATASPVCLKFPAGQVLRIETAPERYVFRFRRASRVTLDGNGCTFLLAPDLRFLRLNESRDVTIRNLKIDFDPLPFADGTVVAVDSDRRFVDVRLSFPGQRLPLGGPTREDGEQAFFGMLWYDGAYGLVSRHYWTERIEPGPGADTVRVFADDCFREFDDIKPGGWRISLPVPGIAHRFGPGACLEICDNDTVTIENVELWSAPWFGFHVLRNAGEVVFRRVHIRPKPESGRLTSTWRDGFHVKGNSGSLLWEDCILSGMNDDAFNLSTHSSRITEILAPTEVVVLQTFPLNPMPWYEGATFAAADFDARTRRGCEKMGLAPSGNGGNPGKSAVAKVPVPILSQPRIGTARIIEVIEQVTPRTIAGRPAASPVALKLDRPIAGLARGDMVWQPEYANPDTVLRRCRIEKSCRFQTSVTLESCDVTAFLWFYGERVEGPFPSRVTIRDCQLRRGRGNPRLSVSFLGRKPGHSGPSAIHDVLIQGNEIWGDFSMIGVDGARLIDNQFREPDASIRVEDCPGLERRSVVPISFLRRAELGDRKRCLSPQK